MNRKKWILLILALLVLALLVWRFTPRSFSAMMGAEKELEEVEIHLMALTVEDGETNFVNYELKADSSNRALMTILEGKGYRPDLWNLLPVRVRPSGLSGDSGLGVICSVFGFWDDRQQISLMTMIGRKKCLVGGDFYYPVDKGTLEALRDYVMENGMVKD